jgi:hypothetical protein
VEPAAAARDATQRIWDTLKAALATEGLHAEPLDPGVKG